MNRFGERLARVCCFEKAEQEQNRKCDQAMKQYEGHRQETVGVTDDGD